MIRPTEPADLAAVLPPEDAADWWQMLEAPNAWEFLARASSHTVVVAGRPVAIFGKGRLNLAGAHLPWLWLLIDAAGTRQEAFIFWRRIAPMVRSWLDREAQGYYTTAQDGLEVNHSFLRKLGFTHHGSGLYQYVVHL